MADTSRIEELRRRVQRDPASIAFAQLAEEYRRAGRYNEAIETCEQGLAHHPGYLSARVTLGRSYLETSELDGAQLELRQVLRAAPENLAALRGLAEIHHRRGELQEALAYYRTALEFARNDPELQHLVGQISEELEPQPSAPAVLDGLSFEDVKNTFLNLSLNDPEPPPGANAEVNGIVPVAVFDGPSQADVDDAFAWPNEADAGRDLHVEMAPEPLAEPASAHLQESASELHEPHAPESRQEPALDLQEQAASNPCDDLAADISTGPEPSPADDGTLSDASTDGEHAFSCARGASGRRRERHRGDCSDGSGTQRGRPAGGRSRALARDHHRGTPAPRLIPASRIILLPAATGRVGASSSLKIDESLEPESRQPPAQRPVGPR